MTLDMMMINKRKMMGFFGLVPFICLVPGFVMKAEEVKAEEVVAVAGDDERQWSKDDVMIHNLLVHHISLVMKHYNEPKHWLYNIKSELDLMEEMGGIEHFHIVNGDSWMIVTLLWRGETKTRILTFNKKPNEGGIDFTWTNYPNGST